jgi:hypothetical protein
MSGKSGAGKTLTMCADRSSSVALGLNLANAVTTFLSHDSRSKLPLWISFAGESGEIELILRRSVDQMVLPEGEQNGKSHSVRHAELNGCLKRMSLAYAIPIRHGERIYDGTDCGARTTNAVCNLKVDSSQETLNDHAS